MRSFAVAVVVCVLATAAAPQEAPEARQVPSHSAEPQSDAGRDKLAAQPQSAPPAPIIVNVQPPTKTEVEAQKEERERQEKANLDRRLVELTGDLADYTRWLAYATAALFAVTAGLFIFAVLQARDAKEAGRASRRSADAANRSADLAAETLAATNAAMVASERAWVSVDVALRSGLKREADGGGRFILELICKNVGKSPANNVSVFSRISCITSKHTPGSVCRELVEMTQRIVDVNKRLGDVIYPGETKSYYLNDHIDDESMQQSREDHPAIDSTKYYSLFVVGCVGYRLAVGDEVKTSFVEGAIHRRKPEDMNGQYSFDIQDGGEDVPLELVFINRVFASAGAS